MELKSFLQFGVSMLALIRAIIVIIYTIAVCVGAGFTVYLALVTQNT